MPALQKAPRPGSATDQVIQHLTALGPMGEMSRLDVSEMTGIPLSQVTASLSWAIRAGLIEKHVGQGIDWLVYRLPHSVFDPDAADVDAFDDRPVIQRIVPALGRPMPKTTGAASVFHLAQGHFPNTSASAAGQH